MILTWQILEDPISRSFPKLRKSARKYICHAKIQAFSSMKLITNMKSRMTDENLKNSMILATIALTPDVMNNLVKNKQALTYLLFNKCVFIVEIIQWRIEKKLTRRVRKFGHPWSNLSTKSYFTSGVCNLSIGNLIITSFAWSVFRLDAVTKDRVATLSRRNVKREVGVFASIMHGRLRKVSMNDF